MNVLSNLNFAGSSPILESITSFPSSAIEGQMVLIAGIVYIYTKLDNLLSWYPMTNEKNVFVHTQGVASDVWTITHNGGTSDIGVFIYDEFNNLIDATHAYIDDNSFTLTFTTIIKGKAVVFTAVDTLVPTFTMVRESFTALAAQTIFPIDVGYNPTYADVFLNGLKLQTGIDVDVSSGTEIVLSQGANAGDIIEVLGYSYFKLTETPIVLIGEPT